MELLKPLYGLTTACKECDEAPKDCEVEGLRGKLALLDKSIFFRGEELFKYGLWDVWEANVLGGWGVGGVIGKVFLR